MFRRVSGGRLLPSIAVFTALIVASIIAPALGAPAEVSATNLAKKVAQALKLSKSANKISKSANKIAKRALAKAGQPGPTGPAGPAGVKGANGSAGPAGPKGDNGDAGPTGPKGDNGNAGPTGPKGDNGNAGPAGAAGPSGVVATGRFSGGIASTTTTTVFQFLGTPATVTTTAGQRLTGSAMVPVAQAAGAATASLDLDLCYQPSAGGTLVGFAPAGQYSVVQVTGVRNPLAVSNTVVPGAGTLKVGPCVRSAFQGTGTAVALTNNDFVNGYVQVTN